MASAAEQMAANMSWGAFGKATELRQRILFTIGLLMVYRLGTYIPVPGIDGTALRSFMEDAAAGIGGILSMFTGGALSRMGIFALGIMPYISASIIVQLLGSMWEPLKNLKKEGEAGRRKLNQYTRYGTVVLATAQAYGLAVSLEAGGLAADPGLFFQASTVITIVGGTMFLMWLGEQITARGIGNGISLIIFVGIIAEIPAAMAQFLSQGRSGAISPLVVIGIIGGMSPQLGAVGLRIFPVVILGGLDSVGGALVGGADAGTEQAAVRLRLGVCPQHDVVWPMLTVAEHLLF